jgi:tRNA modification GTPase
MPQAADTIAAISTPPGAGGIGIVRLSGPQALRLADEVFRGRERPSECATYTAHYGHVVDGAEVLDECLLLVMRAPRSYTREDVVEIHCHGGPVVLRQVLDLVVRKGARLAGPGEFTQRAFLNGRIDLVQAEAVMDLIRAQTDLSRRAAMAQLDGHLSRRVEALRQRLQDFLVHVEASLDFLDDDIEIISRQEQQRRAEELVAELRRLEEGAEAGQILREGVTAAIVGRPNVGKSSLMNALLRTNRVIVTPIPGTTRDVIEEGINLRGVPLRLIDTAGLRDSADVVEREGVERTRHWMARADLVLLVLDTSESLQPEDWEGLAAVADKKTVLVLNKADLPAQWEPHLLPPAAATVRVSALHGTGLEELEETLFRLVWQGEVQAGEVWVTNVRHKRALSQARESLERVLETLAQGYTEELVAVDLRAALHQLGEIVGVTLTEDVIRQIFETFCIGK